MSQINGMERFSPSIDESLAQNSAIQKSQALRKVAYNLHYLRNQYCVARKDYETQMSTVGGYPNFADFLYSSWIGPFSRTGWSLLAGTT